MAAASSNSLRRTLHINYWKKCLMDKKSEGGREDKDRERESKKGEKERTEDEKERESTVCWQSSPPSWRRAGGQAHQAPRDTHHHTCLPLI